MIPIGVPSFTALLLLLGVPLFAVLGSVFVLLRWLRSKLRKQSFKRPSWLLIVLLCAAYLWILYLLLALLYLEPLRFERILDRREFVLQQPLQQGEVLLPAGTQIYRVDNHDAGLASYRQTLTDSFVAVFPTSVEIAGLSVAAIDTTVSIYPKLLLAQDFAEAGCGKGSLAEFDNLQHGFNEARDERGRSLPDPEGLQANLRPSQWTFLACREAGISDFRLGSAK